MQQNKAILKKMLFPVERPGEYITADWELLFFLPIRFRQNTIFFFFKKGKKG